MSVVLLILKIIGIAILAVVSLALLVVLLVLFVPVRYFITAEKYEEKDFLCIVKATWLLHFVNITVKYLNELYYKVRITIIPIIKSDNLRKKKKTTKRKKSTKTSTKDTTEVVEIEPEVEPEVDELDEVHRLLRIAYEKYSDDDGYTNIASAGQYIRRTMPGFDLRTYHYKKLPELIAAFPDRYEIKKAPGKGTVTIISYRCKE